MSDATIIREAVQPLTGSAQDYDSLLALIGDARFVLLGEASHGTHEFYAERAAITKRLIAERGFTVVAIEADWAGRESRAPLRARCERRCRVAGIALVGASRGSILARRWRSDQHPVYWKMDLPRQHAHSYGRSTDQVRDVSSGRMAESG
jgi:hypothetical protein